MSEHILLVLTKKCIVIHCSTRAARFQLNPFDTNEWKDNINNKRWGLLDELMSEIPEKENYQGSLTDGIFGDVAHTLDPRSPGKVLNATFYHRNFRVETKGAMGLQTQSRGFADENVFMAKTV